MNLPKILSFTALVVFVAFTTTSCVSNYVVSNSTYKYPKSNELLLAHNNTKGPNATRTEDKVLKSEPLSMPKPDVSDLEHINNYAENKTSLIEYNVIQEAKTYLGTPYRFGGTTRYGIDCSSFVQQVFQANNFFLPRTSASQSNEGIGITRDNLKRGDLIFFSQGYRISHVGIVESISETGEVFFIHASSSLGVTITSLSDTYWSKRFRKAKRIIANTQDFITSNNKKQSQQFQL
ncbi:MAG: C40 family peptidase [Flavobacteriaceae bacterium]|jgi:lipoprotein Spr|nr:C40 family peptidase [Flavobacteriaceae bacterium]